MPTTTHQTELEAALAPHAVLRNSRPEIVAKRPVAVATSATRINVELRDMRRQLDAVADKALIAAIAAAERALISVQIEAGAKRVLVA